MLDGGSIALALHWWSNVVSLVVAYPIPLDGPALKDIESCCPKKPQDDVDRIGPPSDAQPFLID